jgi:hypothetical protein
MPRAGLHASTSSWAGTNCRPSCRADELARAGVTPSGAAPAAGARRRAPADPTGSDRLQQRAVRRHAAALVGRARLHQPVRPQGGREVHHRHGGGQRARHRGRHRVRHAPHRAGLRQPCPSRCWKARASASSRRAGRHGRPHHARQYSIASPRNGERPGYNNLSLTIKRVLEDHQGQPVRGVASNYMCDLKVGDKVQCHRAVRHQLPDAQPPKSHIVMICTGTGSAPMRAMTEWRRRLRQSASSRAAS